MAVVGGQAEAGFWNLLECEGWAVPSLGATKGGSEDLFQPECDLFLLAL